METTLEAPLVDLASGDSRGTSLLDGLDLVLGSATRPSICDFKTAGSSTAPLEVSHEIQLSC